MTKTLVLIPTYNEKDNIPILIADLMTIPGVSVMVLDDQSPDGTGKVADALGQEYPGRVQALHRTGQRGLGVSYLEGFHRAIESDFDFVGQMDADLSHDPKYLPAMIEAASQGADLVIGSRYLNGISVVNWPLRRIILSQFANFYIRTVTGLGLRDITTKLPLPPLVLHDKVNAPPVLVEVVTRPVGPGGMTGNVTLGPVRLKSSKIASRVAVANDA